MKKTKILIAFIMLISLSACGSTKPEASSDKEVLVDALQQFEKLESVEGVQKGEGTRVATSDFKTLSSNEYKNQSQFKYILDQKQIYYIGNYIGAGDLPTITFWRDDGKEEVYISSLYGDNNIQDHLVKEGSVTTTFTSASTNEGKITCLSYYNYFVDEKFDDCIAISSNKENGNQVIALKMKDKKLFNEKLLELKKEISSEYDPSTYAGVPIDQNTTTVFELYFTIDKDGNVIKFKEKQAIDFGNNLVNNTNNETTFTNFNQAKYDIERLNNDLEKVKNGEYKEGSKIEFVDIPAIE